jgi:hypothetical protein
MSLGPALAFPNANAITASGPQVHAFPHGKLMALMEALRQQQEPYDTTGFLQPSCLTTEGSTPRGERRCRRPRVSTWQTYGLDEWAEKDTS